MEGVHTSPCSVEVCLASGSVVVHACNASFARAKAGGSQVQGQPQQLREALSPNKRQKDGVQLSGGGLHRVQETLGLPPPPPPYKRKRKREGGRKGKKETQGGRRRDPHHREAESPGLWPGPQVQGQCHSQGGLKKALTSQEQSRLSGALSRPCEPQRARGLPFGVLHAWALALSIVFSAFEDGDKNSRSCTSVTGSFPEGSDWSLEDLLHFPGPDQESADGRTSFPQFWEPEPEVCPCSRTPAGRRRALWAPSPGAAPPRVHQQARPASRVTPGAAPRPVLSSDVSWPLPSAYLHGTSHFLQDSSHSGGAHPKAPPQPDGSAKALFPNKPALKEAEGECPRTWWEDTAQPTAVQMSTWSISQLKPRVRSSHSEPPSTFSWPVST
ncbi:hypothetical protein H1C71_027056 [Ictidomys tridecemlineatus]|uniref:uncharacterized protein LOC120889216 n=1 Tax=Ictidomys tridecemlineatus TaxID=43179 RepID=UPI001A9D52C3|nr:uncharacterized protein LOC120889216 [Ictidomys tridecemlineatus]KAG3290594.1 hypothetical protein H1C71_027056 [Ictidomys tridecemlineatus]